jgi:hypothetical protein
VQLESGRGVGEGVDDLESSEAQEFARAIVGLED